MYSESLIESVIVLQMSIRNGLNHIMRASDASTCIINMLLTTDGRCEDLLTKEFMTHPLWTQGGFARNTQKGSTFDTNTDIGLLVMTDKFGIGRTSQMKP